MCLAEAVAARCDALGGSVRRAGAGRKSAEWPNRWAIGLGSPRTPAGNLPLALAASGLSLSCPIKTRWHVALFPQQTGLAAARIDFLAAKWKQRGTDSARITLRLTG
jgi:hypothetical protein